MRKELKALKQGFDELNASHERLEETHEKLGKAHKKLEKVHSSLLDEQNEKKHIVTCDKGLTCDIIDESFYKTDDFLVFIVIDWLHHCDWLNSSTRRYNHHIPYLAFTFLVLLCSLV